MSYEGYVDHLLLLIKEKRDTMIVVANKTGYISEQTIKCSQDLDKLIYQYQELTYESNREMTKNRSQRTAKIFESTKS
ncbi:aspartyl-phosphate phosphatase Spo0E family protein [Sutcliffiella rhizosphaerae]|uniref:Aspartyl-phosphate phosphatase Spo0E family protein n=1 Tax=Sutcliffiella rhizosphaerae TaxID=2880967 RepID=A0ABM8YL40_9BACI|nr:aspartyl-phosphate phosphatase Spo0E family protein [Sutcliffiella rhizosphaerae]CAG9620557.1 hypothetical protein BACCIP111883_01326 [Sutcliffiella rhizosphaerae]